MLDLKTRLETGDVVQPDEWFLANKLVPAWEGDRSPFRLLSGQHEGVCYPCNVRVTGRTAQRRSGDYYQRVQIEFLNLDDLHGPSTFSGGWVLLNW